MLTRENFMQSPLFRSFRLAASKSDGRHPYVNKNGAFHGDGLVLIERGPFGNRRPRSRDQLELALSAGYGFPVDLSRRMQSLEAVAKALDENDSCRAAIALVQAQFLPLPDVQSALKMTIADALTKSDAWRTQPRVPAGQSGGGQWTSEGAGAAAGRLAELLRSSRYLHAARIIAEGVLFPNNANLEANGAVPGNPGLDYRFTEMRLTLIQHGDAGGARLLFSGMPDSDGEYRDQGGAVVGRAIGNSFMLEDAGVAAMDAARTEGRASTDTASDQASDQPKLCADPTPDRPGGMSERAAAYQEQITGLPRGMAVELNGLKFDGCRTTDGTMLEAKGPGLQQHLDETANGSRISSSVAANSASTSNSEINQLPRAKGRSSGTSRNHPSLHTFVKPLRTRTSKTLLF